jgi:hypothetical protein
MAEPRDQPRKLVILVALHHPRGDPAALASDDISLVEQHRLANATQPIQHEAAGKLAGPEPLERDPKVLELGISTGQERWPSSGARRVRVGLTIHCLR